MRRLRTPLARLVLNNVNARLDRLGNRVSPEDHKKIEDAIAHKVKRPTPEEIEDAELDAMVQAPILSVAAAEDLEA